MIIVKKLYFFIIFVIVGLCVLVVLSIYQSYWVLVVVGYLMQNIVFSIFVLDQVIELVYVIWLNVVCYFIEFMICEKIFFVFELLYEKVQVVFFKYERECIFDVNDIKMLEQDCVVFVDYEKV